MRVPEQPSGWPSAIAPPSELTTSSSSPRSRMQAIDCDANASLSSTASRSPMPQPARSSTLRVAGTGPMPMMSGATPAFAPATTRARGARPCASAYRSLTRTTAAAPSLSELELPAVITPPGPWIGRSAASFSAVVSGRGPSSASTSPTATISLSKRPLCAASRARWWERSANASSSSRFRPHCSATRSAVCGMVRVTSSPNCGLAKRQPMEVSKLRPGLAHGRAGFSVTHGARVIDSTPPATTTSASPAAIIWRAVVIAVMPEAHSRLTVKPGIDSGSPASSVAIRATLRLSSPAWLAAPKMTSSMSSTPTPLRSTTLRTTSAARSSGRLPDRAPP